MYNFASVSEPNSGSVIINGVRLRYYDWGGDGPPLVLLHATSFLTRIYAPIAAALTAVGHVFSYDQRGHGDSGPAPEGDEYSWFRTADDLEGFITAMGFKGVLAFGHSAGATAFGAVGSRRPELISRAVLAEPVLFATDPQEGLGPLAALTLKRKRSFDSVEAMFDNFKDKFPYSTWRPDVLRDYCEYGTRPAPGGKRELKCTPEVEAEIYSHAGDFDGRARLLRCAVPMLIIFGEKSESPGVDLHERLAAGLKNARVVVIPGAHHLITMEMPDRIARMAIEFLRPE
jgi:lipase